jgi:hypothetical protein
MSRMKYYAEQVSIDMGLGGELTEEVLREASRRLKQQEGRTHTPGPWAVGQYTPTPHFLAITNHSCVCDPTTMALIATCGRAGDRQSQIDADLIAAAPALLTACEAAHGLLIHGDESTEDDWTSLGHQLAAAIRLAKGDG